MTWYIATLSMHKLGLEIEGYSVREYYALVEAESHDLAYVKSIGLGRRLPDDLLSSTRGTASRDHWVFDGLSDLLMVYEAPKDGSELIWSQEEVPAAELQRDTRRKQQLRVFAEGSVSRAPTGWYVASIVLAEVHDTGSHGPTLLRWINWYLVNAKNAESAYRRALEIGARQASGSGSHKCDGDTAHWEFKGIRQLVETLSRPRDGSILWFDQFEVSRDRFKRLVPEKSALGVFRWEAERRGQDSSLTTQ